MQLKEINEKLKDVSTWTAPIMYPLRIAFLTHFKDRQYGEDALKDAWHWYTVGWADGRHYENRDH